MTFCLEKQECHKTNNHRVPMVILLVCVNVYHPQKLFQPGHGPNYSQLMEMGVDHIQKYMHDKASLKRHSLSVFALLEEVSLL